ncbi:drug resistance transporter, EmrB/QacA subfamily [Alicyclobacillus acidocaldarius subsp. acidocaldarius Tc-4-1]|uniref:Drug resistance transporter, EmrB/QacA subfamily n=2 Tax=Alicyclobacillus acidocaldarius TaxID=405212 RepID=F8IK85_ALIAT|nr:drug resistance transporter, EmrB/QacA subfamily [Alicyclobacillus acidocaldarius subsp. acidocaldarius Tc-4-1]
MGGGFDRFGEEGVRMHHTNRRMVSVAMMLAVFLVAIDVTVVSTAMPHIVRQLHGLNLYSWVFAIYTLTTCVTTPIYGKLADLFGRRTIFCIGVVLFVIGSALSGLSQNMAELVWFRAFQGLGAGAVMPVTFTIIGDIFQGEERARMQGLFSSVWGVAGLLGPLVGGLFVDHVSWRWIFYINVPVGALSLVLVLLFLHERFERRQHRVDVWGALVFTIGVSSLLYALLNGGSKYAWTSAVILGLFAASAVFLAAFVWIEAKVAEPILPLKLLSNPVIAVSDVLAFLAAFVLIGGNVYLPMWIQTILGHSATNSGLTLMPMSLAWPLASTLSGRYMYRIGAKRTTVTGTLLVAVATAWLLAIKLGTPYWFFVGVMIVMGLGMGYLNTPTTVMIQSVVSWQMRGAATGSNQFARALGQTIGVTVFGSLFNSITASYVRTNAPAGVNRGDLTQILNNLSGGGQAAGIPAEVKRFVDGMLAHTLHDIFLAMFCVSLAIVVIAWFLPSHAKLMEQQAKVQANRAHA